MADFQPAVQNTELWEGGYSNNAADSGGETYRGISRNNWPAWSGWVLVDIGKSQVNFPKSLDLNCIVQACVVEFYKLNFWHYDGINDQAIANKIFDLCVNVGQFHGIKITQQAVNALGISLSIDGKYGPGTEAAINSTPIGSLLPSIRLQAEQYHNEIVEVHPEDARFLNGWLRRDEACGSHSTVSSNQS